MTELEVPFERRNKKVDYKDTSFLSPIDCKEKDATKTSLGVINFDQMWRPSVCTLLTNTGTQLKLELTSPGSLKWKPVGDVSYVLSDVKFFWAFDNYGSCHMIDGKKYALEATFTFKHSYDVTVSSELLLNRLDLHKKYMDLENAKGDEERAELEAIVDEKEAEYDELELNVLNKRYIHSEAKEALSKRKPTKFVLEKVRQVTTVNDNGSDDDESDSLSDDEGVKDKEKEDSATGTKLNLDRDIKFRVERNIHELAARRFAPLYRELLKKKSSLSEEDVEAFLTVNSSQGRKSTTLTTPSSMVTITRVPDDPPIDAKMFPRERDKERERFRRAKYQEEKMKRDQKEEADRLEWIRVHKAELQVKITQMFEVTEDAPYYSLFSFLPRVKEPYSKILVDGNLLLPFQDALASPDFYTYVGSRFFYPDQEVVWIVMKNPLPISKEQLWSLRDMKNEYGKRMESNTTTRMEDVNGRKVYFNVPVPKPEIPTCPGKDKCLCEFA